MVVGREAQPVAAGHLGALAGTAAQDPDLHRRALAWDGVRVQAAGRPVGTPQQGAQVVDLLAVVLRLGVRELEQRALQREPGGLEQVLGGNLDAWNGSV
jgi:hypothetical protein